MNYTSKDKHIQIHVYPTPILKDVAVSMSIPFSGISSHCLQKLLCSCNETEVLYTGSEEAALAFALYEKIKEKMMGTPQEVAKTKTNGLGCSAVGGKLVISWTCASAITQIRKTCALAVACLLPNSLYSKYAENIKFLSKKSGNKETFTYCAKKLADGIHSGVDIVIVGKTSIDAARLPAIGETISSKFKLEKVTGSGEKPAKHDAAMIDWPLLKCSDEEAVIVADYINYKSGGMAARVVNEGVRIFNHGWPTKHAALKKKGPIDNYVNKFTKIIDNASYLFAYIAITDGYASNQTLLKILKSKYTKDRIAGIIKSALK